MALTRKYVRDGDALEFERVAFFSDAVFAIAMTVIAIGISIPVLDNDSSSSELWEALGERWDELLSFAISFVVLGSFWVAHHRFYARLRAVDPLLIRLNLIYLGFVAIQPFPTSVLGEYGSNSVAVAFYAVMVAAVSAMEVLVTFTAHRRKLFTREMPPDVFRYSMIASSVPVLFFLVSVPLAFIDPRFGYWTWLALIPASNIIGRRKPPNADDVLG